MVDATHYDICPNIPVQAVENKHMFFLGSDLCTAADELKAIGPVDICA
jgi:hypothetical protein